jgi:hypothetical protein
VEFNLVIDEEFYRFFKPDPDSCGFASPFGEVWLNLPRIHRALAELVREERAELEKEFGFSDLDGGQRYKITNLVINPFTDDIYLTKIVGALNHEVFHVLLYNQEDFYRSGRSGEESKDSHHLAIDHLEGDSFYSFRWGIMDEPVDLLMYLKDFL